MLTETQQGSNSGQSATHDSDPRKLEFETIGFDDKSIEELGTLADLTKCLTLGGVPGSPGPVLSDLSGGGGSSLLLEACDPSTVHDITAGDYLCTMHFTDGAMNYDQIFDITMPVLTALMAAQPESANGYKIDISTIAGNWLTYVGLGYTVFGIDFISNTPFSGPSVRLRNMTGALSFGVDRAHDNNFTIPDTGNAAVIIFSPDQTTIYNESFDSVVPGPTDRLYLNLEFNIDGSTTTHGLVIGANADYINSFASAAQLAAQQLDDTSGQVPAVRVPFTFPYDVSYITVTTAPVTFAVPDTTGFSNIAFDLGSDDNGWTRVEEDSYANFPTATEHDYHAFPIPAAWFTSAYMRCTIYLYPTIVPPTYNPIMITKPYEMRLRNNAAFRFNFVPDDPSAPPPYNNLIINIAAIVSGGTVDGKMLWTKIPLQSFGNNNAQGVSTDTMVITFPSRLTWLPLNWQGDIFQIATCTVAANDTFVGPWNYIRFFMMNPGGESTQDYSGWRLEVIANAREL